MIYSPAVQCSGEHLSDVDVAKILALDTVSTSQGKVASLIKCSCAARDRNLQTVKLSKGGTSSGNSVGYIGVVIGRINGRSMWSGWHGSVFNHFLKIFDVIVSSSSMRAWLSPRVSAAAALLVTEPEFAITDGKNMLRIRFRRYRWMKLDNCQGAAYQNVMSHDSSSILGNWIVYAIVYILAAGPHRLGLILCDLCYYSSQLTPTSSTPLDSSSVPTE